MLTVGVREIRDREITSELLSFVYTRYYYGISSNEQSRGNCILRSELMRECALQSENVFAFAVRFLLWAFVLIFDVTISLFTLASEWICFSLHSCCIRLLFFFMHCMNSFGKINRSTNKFYSAKFPNEWITQIWCILNIWLQFRKNEVQYLRLSISTDDFIIWLCQLLSFCRNPLPHT